MLDIRKDAARYYDRYPFPFDDVSFYKERIPSPEARILELGCGTGRVLVPLAASCTVIHGLDCSEAMLEVCREKLREAKIPPERAHVDQADIADFLLGPAAGSFDLITAPYRVFQNLETDAQVDGVLRCIRRHLTPNGTCILNVFKPRSSAEEIRRGEWCKDTETLSWETAVPGGRVTCHDRRPRVDPENLVLYPELIYRRYEGDRLVDETVLAIVMRCYYPDSFEKLIVDHGFRVVAKWGGYAGEKYGEGTELVIEFAAE